MDSKPQFITEYALDFTEESATCSHYQALLEPMFRLEATYAEPFQCQSKVYLLNDVIFSASNACTQSALLTRDAAVIQAFGLNHLLVLFYKDHPIAITVDGITTEVPAESLLFIDLSKPITIQAKNIHNLSINIPRTNFEKQMPLPEDLHGFVLNQGPHYALLLAHMKALEQVAPQVLESDSIQLSETILNLVVNAAKQVVARKKTQRALNAAVSTTDIKHAIDKQIANPDLSVEWLTKQFNISRATLYRMFESSEGVADYILSKRLEFAYKQLLDTEIKIRIHTLSEILGFSHTSAFSRAFQTKFGVRPSKIKAQAGGKTKAIVPWAVNLEVEKYRR